MLDRIFSKFSIIFLAFLLSLVLSLPFKAHSSDKMLVLFPMAMYADQSKSYLKQGIKIMLMSRLSGGGIDIISDEALQPLLDGKEKDGVISKKSRGYCKEVKGGLCRFWQHHRCWRRL